MLALSAVSAFAWSLCLHARPICVDSCISMQGCYCAYFLPSSWKRSRNLSATSAEMAASSASGLALRTADVVALFFFLDFAPLRFFLVDFTCEGGALGGAALVEVADDSSAVNDTDPVALLSAIALRNLAFSACSA